MASLFGAALLTAGTADAWYVRQHASQCYRANIMGPFYPQNQATGEHHGFQNLNPSGTADLVCPVPDTSVTRKDQLTYAWLNSRVYRSDSPISAKDCRADLTGQTGACSPLMTTTTGALDLMLHKAYWGPDLNSFAYTYVVVGWGAEFHGIGYGG